MTALGSPDPFQLSKQYKFLRVADVCDALDGIGYFEIGRISQEIRPLWLGMKFWGPALTVRCVPANSPMWKLETTDEIVRSHGIWFEKHPWKGFNHLIQPGSVVVCDTGSAGEVGMWGSENTLAAITAGAVGIVTNGHCRDTAEVAMQKVPICLKSRGRTIIPGRIEIAELQTPIGIGGQQVRPGDIVGCDDDGLVVVPLEVADEVATHAKAVLIADMKARRKHYERLGREPDYSVDYETVEAYYAGLS